MLYFLYSRSKVCVLLHRVQTERRSVFGHPGTASLLTSIPACDVMLAGHKRRRRRRSRSCDRVIWTSLCFVLVWFFYTSNQDNFTPTRKTRSERVCKWTLFRIRIGINNISHAEWNFFPNGPNIGPESSKMISKYEAFVFWSGFFSSYWCECL